MTRRKTISSLSITAIALLAAAVPSFAQGQSDQSNRDLQSSVALQSEQAIASNTELIATTRSGVATTARGIEVVNNVTRTAGPLVLSAKSFQVQNNYTSITSSQFVRPQLSLMDAGPSDPSGRKQFRGDDDNSSSRGRKLVTFVPSRGQKLPE